MASNPRAFWYHLPEEPDKKRFYYHTSMTICLPEMASLFRKHMEDLVNFLLQTYDCGDYDRATHIRGEEKIQNCCMNIIAGTTPSFLRRIFNSELVDQGFASRGMWIYGKENRFNRAKPPTFDEDMVAAHGDLLKHIKSVANLFGECRLSSDADKFIEHWAENIVPNQRAKVTDERQLNYISRKEVLVQKLAMTKHYGESTEKIIEKSSCEWAVEAVERIYKNMLQCFQSEGKNPLDDVTQAILRFIRNTEGGAGITQIWMQFWKEFPNGRKSLDDIIAYLCGTEQIKAVGNKYKIKE
jgi:hypothetical protein